MDFSAIVPSERGLVFTLGLVQFVNVLDFVMVMPLGPDFSRALGFPAAHIGYIGGSYTAAAAVSGLLSASFLDRFDRRSALVLALLGLAAGTLAGAFATSFATLLAARVLAGVFGGPAASLAQSILADVVPPARRGRAMGALMGAFAAASVLGVPTGLWLASHGGWRVPFLGVATLGVLAGAAARASLPSLTLHLRGSAQSAGLGTTLPRLLRDPLVRHALVLTALVMLAGFVLIPNISGYVQGNLHYPRERLGLLYLAGGLVSFVTTRFGGRAVDAWGEPSVGLAGALATAVTIFLGFVLVPPPVPVVVVFMLFMLASGLRNVAYQTLTSRVPRSSVRAGFMSLQSAVAHLSAAAGAFLSSHMLSDGPALTLVGMGRLAWLSIALTLAVPPVLHGLSAALANRRPVGAAGHAAGGSPRGA